MVKGDEGMMETFQRSPGTITPVPDPTSLTTDQLYREIGRLSDQLDRRVQHLTDLSDAHIDKIELRFRMLEEHRLEQKSDGAKALEAALTSQREATRERDAATEKASAKAETVMLEGLKQLRAQFDTKFDSLDRMMGDTKARIGKVEDVKTGGKEANANTVALAGLVLTFLGIANIIVTFVVLR